MTDTHTRNDLLIGITLLVVLTAAVFGIRMSGPSDLLDNDQLRPAAYALDVVVNGHWIVQTDFGGDIASKPPLYTWLVALASWSSGRVSLWTLYLPCAMAVAFTAAMMFVGARRSFGIAPAFLGGGMLVLSSFGFKHVTLARTDAVFMATVAATALLVWRAWSMGSEAGYSGPRCSRSWTAAWLAAGLAALTKGPLGVLLGFVGLLAVVWERRTGRRAPLRGSHWLGAALCLAMAGGWFVAAYAAAGDPFIDKVIGRELVGHVVGASKEHLQQVSVTERLTSFVVGLGKPSAYLLSRFLPWSVLTSVGLWRVFKRPSPDDTERRFERFLTCWLLAGLALFSVMPHQRADLLLPLLPAAALLAGREGARVMMGVAAWKRVAIAGCVACAGLAAGAYHFVVMNAAQPDVQRTEGVRRVAQDVAWFAEGRPGLRIIDVDSNGGMQFHLHLKQTREDLEAAVAALCKPSPVVVLTRDLTALRAALGREPNVVSSWPSEGEPFVAAVTNVPRL